MDPTFIGPSSYLSLRFENGPITYKILYYLSLISTIYLRLHALANHRLMKLLMPPSYVQLLTPFAASIRGGTLDTLLPRPT